MDSSNSKFYFKKAADFSASGNLNQSIRFYEKAILLQPDYVDAHFHLSHDLICNGELQKGFLEYEWRFLQSPINHYPHNSPKWHGEQLHHKIIYIWKEQGLKQEILFASLIVDMMPLAKKCIISCTTDLFPLLSRSFSNAHIVDENDSNTPLPVYHFHSPMGSLPRFLRSNIETFPDRSGYLKPHARQVTYFRTKYKPFNKPCIGIYWKKSIPYPVPLHIWSCILSKPHIAWIDIHDSDLKHELLIKNQFVRNDMLIAPDSDNHATLDTIAAQIAALDLVITVDCSIAYLAAAIGKPVWVILPYMPIWPWCKDLDYNYWFHGMRAFRQSKQTDWQEIINTIHLSLQEWMISYNKRNNPAHNMNHEQEQEQEQTTFTHAVFLHQNGQLDQAKQIYEQWLLDHPHHHEALHCMGLLYFQQEQFDLAIDFFDKAIAIKNDNPSYMRDLADAYQKRDQFELAIHWYKNALMYQPKYPEALCNMGIAYQALNNHTEAIRLFSQTINIHPTYEDAYLSAGISFKSLGDVHQAIQFYKMGIDVKQDYPELYFNLGICYQDIGEFDQAIESYEKALFYRSHFPEVYINLGNIWDQKKNYDKAIDCFNHARTLRHNFPEAWYNLGRTYRNLAQIDKAIQYYKIAIDLNPDYIVAKYNLSLVYFLQGDFKNGFYYYEWRFQNDPELNRSFPFPQWDGSPLGNKTIYIWGEQGVGDEIMFSTMFHDVIPLAKQCIIECDKRLIPLFSRSFSNAQFVAKQADNKPYTTHGDFHVPAGSLGKYFRSYDQPIQFPFKPLQSNPSLKQRCVKTYNQWHHKLIVGISWQSGNPMNGSQRSIPLSQWGPILTRKNILFVNLQYGDCQSDIQVANNQFGVSIFCDSEINPLESLDNFAAQVDAIDLVISIDNSTVHMAGALNIPVWILLPFSPDWHWLIHSNRSPWYPSVRLFRQKIMDSWKETIEEVADALSYFKK